MVSPYHRNSINRQVISNSVLDGIYYQDDQQKIRFKRLPPPCNGEVARVTASIARRIAWLLERRGLGATRILTRRILCCAISSCLLNCILHRCRGSSPLVRAREISFWHLELKPKMEASLFDSSGCAAVSGFSLHGNVCIPAKARRQLENLCRYAARPAVATEHLSVLADGRLLYRLRHRWRNGATHVVFEPLEFVASSRPQFLRPCLIS